MKIKTTLLLYFILFWSIPTLSAQSRLNNSASGTYKSKNIYEILSGLETTYNVRFCNDPELLPWYKLDYSFTNKTLHEVLKGLLNKNTLTYVPLNDSLIAVCRIQDLQSAYIKDLRTRCVNGTIELPEMLQPLKLEKSLGDANSAVKSSKIAIAEPRNPNSKSFVISSI